MERESRQWIASCQNCGHESSVWDRGGIRWKAAGEPRRRLPCASCGQTAWHTIARLGH